jgi:hypothetical protein
MNATDDQVRQALADLCAAVTEHVSPTHRKGMSHAELGARLRKARKVLDQQRVLA